MGADSPQADLEAWAVRASPDREPSAVRDEFRRSLTAYRDRRREPLARLSVTVDGRSTPSLAAAFTASDHRFENATFEVTGGPPSGRRWDYLLPLRRLRFGGDGSVELEGPDGHIERAIARLLVRERFRPELGTTTPRAGANGGLTPGLKSLREFAGALRAASVTPVSIVVLTYLPERRVRFEIDLTDDALEPDIRAGRLSVDHFVPRTSRISHGVDAFIARGELSVSASRLLEVLVETHGLTAMEAAATFGGIHEMSNTALEALRARRLATFDSAHGVYRARLDAFLAAGSTAQSLTEPLPPMSTPALRTSVTELIAAADSRATCPLCGEVLPPGPHGMLCSKCAAEVGASRADRSST